MELFFDNPKNINSKYKHKLVFFCFIVPVKGLITLNSSALCLDTVFLYCHIPTADS